MKFKILNKKGFDKKNIGRAQTAVKGEPVKAGDVVDLEFDSPDAKELVFSGLAMPVKSAKDMTADEKRLYGGWDGPDYTDAPLETSKAVNAGFVNPFEKLASAIDKLTEVIEKKMK